MTLYDEYRREFPIAAEPSEFRGIIEMVALILIGIGASTKDYPDAFASLRRLWRIN